MGRLFNGIWEKIRGAFEALFNALAAALEWLKDAIADTFLSVAATLVEAIPVPDFIANITSLPKFPAGVTYISEVFLVPQGFAIIFAALGARFILRRIPLIG
nr:hypothetical protein [Oceanococcus sp. HetDA_MAG_MS8]